MNGEFVSAGKKSESIWDGIKKIFVGKLIREWMKSKKAKFGNSVTWKSSNICEVGY